MSDEANSHNPKTRTKIEELLSSLPVVLLREGYMLRGFRLQYQVSSWFLILNVRDAEDIRWVAYQGGQTVTKCIERIYKELQGGGIRWKEDRYQD